tara:strand:- start:22702 stop:22977 length:276 start_codon:yes stop_codon:yes gene_type:complete
MYVVIVILAFVVIVTDLTYSLGFVHPFLKQQGKQSKVPKFVSWSSFVEYSILLSIEGKAKADGTRQKMDIYRWRYKHRNVDLHRITGISST